MKGLLILCAGVAAAVVMSGCNPNRNSSSLMNQPRGNPGQVSGQNEQQPGTAASEQPGAAASQQPGVAASPGVSTQNTYQKPDTGMNAPAH